MPRPRICKDDCHFYSRQLPLALCKALPDKQLKPPYSYHAVCPGSSCRHGFSQEQIDRYKADKDLVSLDRLARTPVNSRVRLVRPIF